MAKFKIQKNLSDADMMKGFNEEATFEETMMKSEEIVFHKGKTVKAAPSIEEDALDEFLKPSAKAEIGKQLLALKLEYFKEGVKDFSVQVRRQGTQIIIDTVPKKSK